MSAKSVIQKLEDCDLIRLFLEFVQSHQLQYQKNSKEISYKCYEATWVLINFKANGYGRTQSQAYKNALRNLLEILIQQPAYIEFFANTLAIITASNARPSVKKQPLTESIQNQPKRIFNSKTQGHEPLQKQNVGKSQIEPKVYQSYSKTNQKSQSKFGTLKGWDNTSAKMTESVGVYHTSQPQNQGIKKVSDSMINSGSHGYNTKIDKKSSESSSQELRKALKKLAQLEEYLQNVNKQNQELKRQLKEINEKQLIEEKENIEFTSSNEYVQKVQVLDQNECQTFVKSKPLVPKLKLQILPNYHKKSQKPLNDSLLAAYNEKRQHSVKKLVC